MIGYYVISPRVVLENVSEQRYDEFIIILPASRISFGPIESHSLNKIYYSRQKEAGTGTYSLILSGSEISSGSFPYAAEKELGKELRFTVENGGQVSFSQ